jgi:membrane protease YdiL (CAAX protease family)
MQTALTKLLGNGFAALVVALVYTILHINQGSWIFVLIIFLFALGLSWLRNRSESLLNVCLVHGAANILFFLLLPWR